jgi:hypothetical protein
VLGVWRVLNASDDDLSDYPDIAQVLNGSECVCVLPHHRVQCCNKDWLTRIYESQKRCKRELFVLRTA